MILMDMYPLHDHFNIADTEKGRAGIRNILFIPAKGNSFPYVDHCLIEGIAIASTTVEFGTFDNEYTICILFNHHWIMK